ncbi:MAG: hypothetical protein CMH55_10590, partial [Myxococcales bacterium]|nr:hypothetical protein [Myxococcales bacterium]
MSEENQDRSDILAPSTMPYWTAGGPGEVSVRLPDGRGFDAPPAKFLLAVKAGKLPPDAEVLDLGRP